MDLVILAAGMGSRFGGLKQIEPIDKYGNFIIDYSIFDAKRAGFKRVIFIIKEENYEIFKETVGKRVEKEIEVIYVFQKLDLLPKGYTLPTDRVKPLGTAQALLACKGIVDNKFMIINADDYYGSDAFLVAANYLNNLKEDAKNQYANVGYLVKNTLTENGSVKRGILNFNENKELTSIVESKIEKIDGVIVATPLEDESAKQVVEETKLVSMNMFVFTKDILQYIEDNFVDFMEDNKQNLDSCEYLLPSVISILINENVVKVDILSTTSVWYGITYKDDKPFVVESLAKMMDNKEYPEGLWK